MIRRSSGASYHSLHRFDNDGLSPRDSLGTDVLLPPPVEDELSRKHALCLYASHFLSMWNSRVYEFAAIIFIQNAFPGNLVASSINGIAETVCVILFSSALGRWVDRAPSRLRTLLTTIVVNRITVVVSCSVWFLVLSAADGSYKKILFALVLILGMVEKSSRSANILSMERDWIPSIAAPPKSCYNLTYLNTMIRRIDVLCKFLAPLAISTFIAAFAPVEVAIAVVALCSLLSVFPESWCIYTTWKGNSQIRAQKRISYDASSSVPFTQRGTSQAIFTIISAIQASVRSHVDSISFFFRQPVWIPALCAAVMHGSVLTWSGTLVTYLLNGGFPLSVITVGKAVGSLFEIGSTFVFPRAVNFLSSTTPSLGFHPQKALPRTEAEDALLESNEELDDEARHKGADEDTNARNVNVGVVRAGVWAIRTLSPCLVPVVITLFYLDVTLPSVDSNTSPPPSPLKSHLISIILLITFLGLALLSRWTYDLAATQLAQTLILPSHRSTFGGMEMVMVSCFSLGHWVAAAIWHEQREFKWLALGSFVAVSSAVGCYELWARRWERAKREEEGGKVDEAAEGSSGWIRREVEDLDHG